VAGVASLLCRLRYPWPHLAADPSSDGHGSALAEALRTAANLRRTADAPSTDQPEPPPSTVLHRPCDLLGQRQMLISGTLPARQIVRAYVIHQQVVHGPRVTPTCSEVQARNGARGDCLPGPTHQGGPARGRPGPHAPVAQQYGMGPGWTPRRRAQVGQQGVSICRACVPAPAGARRGLYHAPSLLSPTVPPAPGR